MQDVSSLIIQMHLWQETNLIELFNSHGFFHVFYTFICVVYGSRNQTRSCYRRLQVCIGITCRDVDAQLL